MCLGPKEQPSAEQKILDGGGEGGGGDGSTGMRAMPK